MERKDWVLLVTGCVEEGGLTPVQLQKSLFLIGQKIPNISNYGEFYNFIAYDYGPFCIDVYRDAEILSSEGCVNIGRGLGERFDSYSITAKGLKLSEQIKVQLPPEIYGYVCEMVRWVKSVAFTQLIKTVYAEFPNFAKNSVFK